MKKLAFRSRFIDVCIAQVLLGKGALIVQTWLASTSVGIDFTERSHAQMRKDLLSTGPAQNFLRSGDRILCRQLASAHMLRGGDAPDATTLRDLSANDLEDFKSPKRRRGSLEHWRPW
jgi:hypothetical protein